MKEAYPISDYNYLLYYSEYSQGGHYHHSDFVNETFDYFTEDGYKCVNAHNAYILGTSKWERWMDYYELVSTREEVLEAANTPDTSTDKAIKVVWSNIYYWGYGK